MKQYFAHTRKDETGALLATQTVREHCENTARYAASVLSPMALSQCGYLAGLLHDAGKYTDRFQSYLQCGGTRGSVNHTFAGVRFLLNRYHGKDPEAYDDIVCELLSLTAGSHHGLFDCVSEKKESGFVHRLTKEGIDYEEAMAGFFADCASQSELDTQFHAAKAELSPVLDRIQDITGEDVDIDQYDQETAFYLSLLSRLLLSAVIEGDRRDTAEFMNGTQFPEKLDEPARKQLWSQCLGKVEQKLADFPQVTEIDRARSKISEQCKLAAQMPGGVFRLNVPTGGGKTLSSLRYALAHAEKFGKQRIIFTSPLLSILEQNAKVIREFLQDDSIILEHHSNLVHTEESSERLEQQELLQETWDAPVILTTLVQLLNTLFSGKTAAIRRFHALCNSIIVIDEVQTVPSKMLSLFSLAVNFLAEICGATIVLCSATQPCMEKIGHPLHTPIPELVPYEKDLWKVFQRTKLQDKGELSLEGIGDFALSLLDKHSSLLIVCNTKKEAEALYRQLKCADAALFQLSAAMCVAHRRDTLEALRASLTRRGQKTVCISTQVIEAGVDISFSCVVRLAAGMDSVVQAAGRCNRNGEADLCPVYVVRCRNEALHHLQDIQDGKAATLSLLTEFKLHPEQYEFRLDSDASIGYYYRALYGHKAKDHFDYPVAERSSLFSMLSCNEKMTAEQAERFAFRQAFQTAGSLFEVFDENTTDAIVPYKAGKQLIEDLGSDRAKHDFHYLKKLLEQAKPYTVSLYQYQVRQLEKEHSLLPLAGGAFGLGGHYNEETGFTLEENNLDFLGV